MKMTDAQDLTMHKSTMSLRAPTRRGFLALASGAAASAAGRGSAVAEPAFGEDGLYHEPWFLQSFLDLREDLDSAAAGGKRLAILWELRGCPYCRETHLVNFADADITTYIRDNFEILQLNLIGSRKVMDFDRQELSEKELAQKYGIRFTPTFQFFPPSSDSIEAKEAMAREVARAPGYLKPPHFLAMFRFVRERAYERGSFRDFLAANG
jgi:thioredoxin-related protein